MNFVSSKWSKMLLPIFLALQTFQDEVFGFSSGAADSACGDMIPQHGPEPQTVPNPYKIELSKSTVKGSETIDITLSSIFRNETFKGFLIQVRKPGGDNNTFGEFIETEPAGNASVMECFDKPESAVTHNSADLKEEVIVHWVAPNNETGEFQVFYSVVQDFDHFWTKIPHEEKIRVEDDSTQSSTSSTYYRKDIFSLNMRLLFTFAILLKITS